MINLSPEAYKELFDEVHNILSCNGKFEVPGSAENPDEFWFGGIKYMKDKNKVTKKVTRAPIVLDTNKGWTSNDIDFTVNGVAIEGITEARWMPKVQDFHELHLVVLGMQTKG